MKIVACAAVAALSLASCASAKPGSTPQSTPAQPAAAQAVEIPQTPVGLKVKWVLDEINAEADTTAAAWKDIVDTATIDDKLIDQVVTLLNTNVRQAKPVVATHYEGTDTKAVVTAVGAIGEPFSITIGVTDAGKLNGIYFGPAKPQIAPAASMDEVKARLSALPIDVKALVTRTDPAGNVETIIDMNADKAAPLGSMFKPWVLIAVAEDVAAGKISWDKSMTITDEVKSLPSGELQDRQTGSTVSVREAALKMISISDNTATDMLIDLVGRARVEQVVQQLGTDPALTQPLLKTREMFQLMWGVDDAFRAKFTAATPAQREGLLAEIDAKPLNIDVQTIDRTARWQDGIEWFASANDMAKVHAALAAINDKDVVTALTTNPGIATEGWDRVAFKGGSNMGVLTGSWRGQQADGTTLTVVLLTSSQDVAAVNAAQVELFSLASDMFRLLKD